MKEMQEVFASLSEKRLLTNAEADRYILQLHDGAAPNYGLLYEGLERSPRSANPFGRILNEIVKAQVRYVRRITNVELISVSLSKQEVIPSSYFEPFIHAMWSSVAHLSPAERLINFNELRWNWMLCVVCGRHQWNRVLTSGVGNLSPLPVLGNVIIFPTDEHTVEAANWLGISPLNARFMALCNKCSGSSCLSCGTPIRNLADSVQLKQTGECRACGKVCASSLEPPKLTRQDLRRLAERRKA